MKNLYLLLCLCFAITSFGQIVINEVEADTPGTDDAEFIELLWTPNTALDGYVVVLFNGNDDMSYNSFDLDGYTTDANGFFILANTGIAVAGDFDLGASNAVQNGPDAVAVYQADDTDFPNDTAMTMTGLIDALVYHTGDSEDAGLKAGLGETVQYDEDANSAKDTESVQRKVDGTYETKAPTFRQTNDAATCDLSLTGNSTLCDAFTVGVDTYTASVFFTGGGTSTYNVTSTSGVVGGDDPTSMATGTITVTGVSEGTDITVNVENGGLCDLDSNVTSPTCEPELTLPHYEAFDYVGGTNLGDQAGWENFSGSSNEIDVTSGNLSYSGLPTSMGNLVQMDGSASSNIDAALDFSPVDSGPIFMSFIFRVTDQSLITDVVDGGYFTGFGGGGFQARVWVMPNPDAAGSTFDIGVSDDDDPPSFSTPGGTYSINEEIFVVLSYDFTAGDIKLWINPDSGDFGGSAPTETLTASDSDDIAVDINSIFLRQDSAGETPSMDMDELRIGISWADVTPSVLSVGRTEIQGFTIYPNPVRNGYFTIQSRDNAAKSVEIYDVLGKQVYSRVVQPREKVDVINLSRGIYILRVDEDGKMATRKLVIE